MTTIRRHLIFFSLVLALIFSACTDVATSSPNGMPRTVISQAHSNTTPEGSTVGGCPVQEDARDQLLTMLKNRTDTATWTSISFREMISWTWPQSVEKKDMASWSQADAKVVAQHNGRPVSITGYIALARDGGQASVNCRAQVDSNFYIWLVSHLTRDRSNSIIMEATPLVRAKHPGWTINNFYRITRRGLQVRISGWTMLDPGYHEQLHQTRGTLWEIHPILQVEVQQNGRWVPLDSVQL